MMITTSIISAQRGNRTSKNANVAKIIGKVIDASTKNPIEYSNLVLLQSIDSTQVNGTITNSEGHFVIEGVKPSNYLLKVSFIGYETIYINDLEINSKSNSLDLGEIKLLPTSYEIESATVIANKTPIEYHIDKKVINVSEQSTSISGTAVEVLENVPSVNVDIEGNVSLRGSGSFTLLIDGRPTILDANDALQQIPASTIDNIEIVTNPSAKYDPEGASGIINIIMKKSKYVGMSAIINAHVGLDEKYGTDFITNYRTNGYSFYVGADYRNSNYPGSGQENRVTFNDEFESFLNSTNTNTRGRDGYNFQGGADFTFNKKNQLGLSLRYGDRTSKSNSFVNFHEYTNPVTTERNYENISNRERGGDRFSSSMNYRHIFGENQHEIIGDLDFSYSNGEEFSINEYYEEDGTLSSGRKNTEYGPSRRFRGKIDYTLPIGNQNKIETGLQAEIGRSDDDTKSYIFDANNGNYIFQKDYSYLVEYSRNIYSVYSMYNSKLNKFGYQLGLRGEFTDRLVFIPDSSQSSVINRWDYFPTIHTSYSFNEIVQLMASYTKRIRRPRGYYLEPFLTWEDQNNVRQGNPDLEPEYINSFEIAYMTHIDEVILSLESYYRERENKIERVRAVYDTNVTITTVKNVGTDYTLGAEFMVNADLLNFWNLNFMGDLSQYKLEGTFEGRDYARENFNWSLRLNNTFMITPSTKLQVNGRYRGPSISAQGDYEGYFSTDVALRQDLWERKMSITLQVRDIFQTSKREGTSFGPGFESYHFSQRKSPIVMLNFSLNLNNFKQKRDRSQKNGEDGGEEEF